MFPSHSGSLEEAPAHSWSMGPIEEDKPGQRQHLSDASTDRLDRKGRAGNINDISIGQEGGCKIFILILTHEAPIPHLRPIRLAIDHHGDILDLPIRLDAYDKGDGAVFADLFGDDGKTEAFVIPAREKDDIDILPDRRPRATQDRPHLFPQD